MKNLEHLFLAELEDLYGAEREVLEAFPELVRACSSEKLRSALQAHYDETAAQVERLERIFRSLGRRPRGNSGAMRELVRECTRRARRVPQSPLRDAAVASAAGRVEHWEIAAYSAAQAFARILGYVEAAGLLGRTLQEEMRAEARVTAAAEDMVNQEALSLGSDQAA